jgi:hypothetical protein
VGLCLTVFCTIDVADDLTDVLVNRGEWPGGRCVRVASGAPQEGRTWEAYELKSASQASPLSMEVQRGAGLADGLAADVGHLPVDDVRDQVLSRLAGTVATVEFKLSLVEDWDLLFGTVEAIATMAAGLVFCDGDLAGFYDDVRGQPYLAL